MKFERRQLARLTNIIVVLVTASFWILSASAGWGQTLTFNRTDYPAGMEPSAVAVGDFNGDGKLDLAVGNSLSSAISILLGNGDGTFRSPRSFPVGSGQLTSIVLGDLNGDGKLDLVVAGEYAVYVLIGNGDGTFQPYATYHTNGNPFSVTVEDFNNDGILDFAVQETLPPSVAVLLGKGDGTFGPPVEYATAGPYNFSIASGDFNGDGRLDLAVGTDNGISVLLGNGDGTFQGYAQYQTAGRVFSIQIGDLNGDGKVDLAALIPESSDLHGLQIVSVLLGNGDGTFEAHIDYDTGSTPENCLVSGDFNADGRLDAATSTSADVVSLLVGKGDGTFYSHEDYPTGANPWCIAAGDFNGDSKLDLVTANFDDNSASVLLNTSNIGSGTPGATLFPTSLNFGDVAVGTTSAPLYVTLTNTGSGTLHLSSITVAGDFSQTNTCTALVVARGNCTFRVTFTPTTTGTRIGSITLVDDAPGHIQRINLVGIGGGGSSGVTASPSSLNFGDQEINTVSAPKIVTFTNHDPHSVGIQQIITTGDFFAPTTTCGATLGAGAHCTVNVTFNPTSPPGVKSGNLNFQTTDNLVIVPLLGVATSPGLPRLTATITGYFYDRNTDTLTVTLQVTNIGTGNADNIQITSVVGMVLIGSGSVTYLAPPLPINLFGLAPNASTSPQLMLHVPVTAREIRISERLTWSDDLHRGYGGGFSQVVFP